MDFPWSLGRMPYGVEFSIYIIIAAVDALVEDDAASKSFEAARSSKGPVKAEYMTYSQLLLAAERLSNAISPQLPPRNLTWVVKPHE